MRRIAVLMVIIALLATGCGGAELRQAASDLKAVTAERDSYKSEAEQLKEKVKALEAEVAELKDAPQELLKRAIEAREKGNFEESGQLLDTVVQKFPATPEAAEAPAEREKLNQAITTKKEAERQAYNTAVAKAKAEATPDKAKVVLDDYLRQNPSSAFRADVEKQIAGYAEASRIAAEEAKKPPVEIVSATMDENSIGTPEIHLTIRNVSKKVVDGFEFSVDLFDNYDRPVYHYRIADDGNTYNGINQDKIWSGGQGSWYWTLYGFDLATKYKNLRVRSVHFTDGSTWRP